MSTGSPCSTPDTPTPTKCFSLSNHLPCEIRAAAPSKRSPSAKTTLSTFGKHPTNVAVPFQPPIYEHWEIERIPVRVPENGYTGLVRKTSRVIGLDNRTSQSINFVIRSSGAPVKSKSIDKALQKCTLRFPFIGGRLHTPNVGTNSQVEYQTCALSVQAVLRWVRRACFARLHVLPKEWK